MLTACSVIYGSDDSNQNNRIDSSWLSYYLRLITMIRSVFSRTQTECLDIWSIYPN